MWQLGVVCLNPIRAQVSDTVPYKLFTTCESLGSYWEVGGELVGSWWGLEMMRSCLGSCWELLESIYYRQSRWRVAGESLVTDALIHFACSMRAAAAPSSLCCRCDTMPQTTPTAWIAPAAIETSAPVCAT